MTLSPGCLQTNCLLGRRSDRVGDGAICAILFDEMQARDIMKTHVAKTTPEASLAEAVDLMDIYQVNSLPVVDGQGRLCGVIAEYDVWRTARQLTSVPANAVEPDIPVGAKGVNSGAGSMSVASAMQAAVVSVTEETTVEEIARVFFVNDFTRIPVLSRDSELVGTLNRIDILQAVFEQALILPEG